MRSCASVGLTSFTIASLRVDAGPTTHARLAVKAPARNTRSGVACGRVRSKCVATRASLLGLRLRLRLRSLLHVGAQLDRLRTARSLLQQRLHRGAALVVATLLVIE